MPEPVPERSHQGSISGSGADQPIKMIASYFQFI